MKQRPLRRAKARPRARGFNGTYVVFFCGVALGVGLLAYAGIFLSGPPASVLRRPENTPRIARIQLNQSDSQGQCRQVVFDNASGRFEEAGMGRCQHLIPDELLIDTVQRRAGHASAFSRAFRH
jgi:hypothetical protein